MIICIEKIVHYGSRKILAEKEENSREILSQISHIELKSKYNYFS
jgi:hypothetical protein